MTERPADLGIRLTLDELARVAAGAPAVVSDDAREAMARSEGVLRSAVEDGRTVYGVTTGYGPLAQVRLDPRHAPLLQTKLLDHLASGTGPPFDRETARAIMAARATALAKGRSGVSQRVFDQLLGMLAADIAPAIPERGTVGASGDLTPLAHMALAMTGRGDVLTDHGREPSAQALRGAGLAPVGLGGKDGLALVNGTSVMTAIAALNAVRAEALWRWSVRLSALNAEVFGGYAEAWDPRLAAVRAHPGQIHAHDALNAAIAGSGRTKPVNQPPPRLPDLSGDGRAIPPDTPQDPYSIRCAPQLLGAVRDQIDAHATTVEEELNAVTDNPIIFAEDGHILHGGNFFGQHVAFVSDALTNALIVMAAHAERCVARLCDAKRNGALPPFLTGGTPGLDSGFMGAQVTASALIAEMRALAHPACVQSMPTNADNQDVTPMGTIAARKTAQIVTLTSEVVAVFALVATQAAELTGDLTAFAPAARETLDRVRALSPSLAEDRPLSGDIARLARRMTAL